MRAHELYKELGLKPNADPVEVKRAYRALLKRYHPDLAGANNHTERLDRIVAAYRELMSRREPIPFRTREQTNRRAQSRARGTSCRTGAGRAQGAGRTQGTSYQAGAGRAQGEGRPPGGARHGTTARGWTDAGADGTAAGPRGATAADGGAEREYDLFTLGRMAVESNSVSRRAFAVRMLGNRRKKLAYGYIRQALNDPAEIVVLEAVRAVAKLEILQSGGELATAFHRGSAAVKTAILTAVETIARPQHFHSVILSGLRETDPVLRRRSLRLFRRYTQADASDTGTSRYRRTASFGEGGR